jgi:hypothetical protein
LITPVLPPADNSPGVIADLITGTSSAAFQRLDAEISVLVVGKIAESMRNVWILNLAGSAASFLLSLFLKVRLTECQTKYIMLICILQRQKLPVVAM